MSPSSLIFLIIPAMWVTYLVLYAARRREHLATARNVDRFSTEMRVLQRRVVPVPTSAEGDVPLVSTPSRPNLLIAAPRDPSALAWLGDDSLLGNAAELARRAASGGSRRTQVVVQATRGAASMATTVSHRSRRFRSTVLLALAGMLLLSVPLVLVGALPAWVPVLLFGGSITCLLWVRRAVVAEQAAVARRRTAVRHHRRLAAERAAAAAREARPAAPILPVAQEYAEPGEIRVSDQADLTAPVVAAPTPAPFDLLADPDGWEPMPVPPPTYTLKARADHPLPEPLSVPEPKTYVEHAPAGTTALQVPASNIPVPIDDEDDFDRWVVNG